MRPALLSHGVVPERRSIGRIVDDIETATLASATGRGDLGGDDDEGNQAPPARRLRAVGGDL